MVTEQPKKRPSIDEIAEGLLSDGNKNKPAEPHADSRRKDRSSSKRRSGEKAEAPKPAPVPAPAPMPSMMKPGGSSNGEKASSPAARPEPRQETRSDARPDSRGEQRPERHTESRPAPAPASGERRPAQRSDQRVDRRSEPRRDAHSEPRASTDRRPGKGGASSGGSRSRPQGGGGQRPGQGGKPFSSGGRPGGGHGHASPRPQSADGPRPAPQPAVPRSTELVLGDSITVRELSTMMGMSPIDVIKVLMNNGVMANINQLIDFDTAAIVAGELGFTATQPKPVEAPKEVAPEAPKTLRERISEITDMTRLSPRPPVVTVLGHVDHGKTTLLDAIRQTNVVDTEAGGITQRIGAYQVEVDGKKITFLDTPGHEAFTAMRARGAQVTDLAVLVVAADDGVMPQTREAIDHARAAKVPILVAMNKVDKSNANPELLKQQLADVGLVVEDWGGDVICVPISAKFRRGIDDLLENILLVTEVAELQANPHCPAVGTVVEGKIDRSKGVMATVLVQNGTLRVGDILVIDTIYGHVRAMFDDKGHAIKEAPPASPAVVLGLSEVPPVGEVFEVFESEREARARVEERMATRKATASQPLPVKILTLDDIASQIKAGKVKELNIVLKADVQGSLEPIINSLGQLGNEGLRVHILHSGAGAISESDVMLAAASQAIVIGFAVDADNAARRMAEQGGVDIRRYDVIYTLVEEVDRGLRGLLEPAYKETVLGRAEVRAVFRVPKQGKVAGCYVTDGTIARDARVRVLRSEVKVFDGYVHALKRFTEDVKEIASGFECGVSIDNFTDYQEKDILEFYRKERVEAQ